MSHLQSILPALLAALIATGTAAAPLKIEAGPRNAPRSIEIEPGSGVAFRDCDDCPELVVVPAAAEGVTLGSSDDEPGHLQGEARYSVRLSAFAIGRHEVSVGEYLQCVAAKACREPEWREPGGEHNLDTGKGVTYRSVADTIRGVRQPAVGISWDDATSYAAWLSAKTGRTYRLPSESEWEYAARAGSSMPFWWGAEATRDGKAMACCRGCGSERDGTGFFAVDAFDANPWGLKNVHGNVWEWVADFFCEDRTAANSDGSARASPQCAAQATPEGLRVFRGGSCFYEPIQMRAAMRLRNWPTFRNMTIGFRVARSL